jgi:hypothetical protein
VVLIVTQVVHGNTEHNTVDVDVDDDEDDDDDAAARLTAL